MELENLAAIGVGGTCDRQRNVLLLSRSYRIYSSLELWLWLDPEHNASLTIAVVLSNNGMSRMKNGLFYGLDFLEIPLWSLIPMRALAIILCPRLCWSPRFMWMDICGPTAEGSNVDVTGLRLSPGYAEGHATYWCRRPCDCSGSCLHKSHTRPWSVLQLTVKGKEATFAVVLITTDSQLRKRDLKGFCNNPYPHFTPTHKKKKSNSLDRKTPTRTLNKCNGDSEV